jgi:addiction module RelE/StbE family toxin
MAKVIWSPSSLDDIDAISKYISRDSIYHAALFIDRLFEATDRLKQNPLSGRIIPEIGRESCREIIYGHYRIMYRIEKTNIWITGVIHGARNWKPSV